MFAAALPIPSHHLPGSALATGIRDALVASSFRAHMLGEANPSKSKQTRANQSNSAATQPHANQMLAAKCHLKSTSCSVISPSANQQRTSKEPAKSQQKASKKPAKGQTWSWWPCCAPWCWRCWPRRQSPSCCPFISLPVLAASGA